MNSKPLRPITQDQLEAHIREGVVWLRRIIDIEWARRLGLAIDELVEGRGDQPVDQVLDLTGLALARKSATAANSHRPCLAPAICVTATRSLSSRTPPHGLAGVINRPTESPNFRLRCANQIGNQC